MELVKNVLGQNIRLDIDTDRDVFGLGVATDFTGPPLLVVVVGPWKLEFEVIRG